MPELSQWLRTAIKELCYLKTFDVNPYVLSVGAVMSNFEELPLGILDIKKQIVTRTVNRNL